MCLSLNPDSANIPYVLGRLFSVLEAIQSSANPSINTTIKDKYFNSASATPSRVFPTLGLVAGILVHSLVQQLPEGEDLKLVKGGADNFQPFLVGLNVSDKLTERSFVLGIGWPAGLSELFCGKPVRRTQYLLSF